MSDKFKSNKIYCFCYDVKYIFFINEQNLMRFNYFFLKLFDYFFLKIYNQSILNKYSDFSYLLYFKWSGTSCISLQFYRNIITIFTIFNILSFLFLLLIFNSTSLLWFSQWQMNYKRIYYWQSYVNVVLCKLSNSIKLVKIFPLKKWYWCQK